MNKFSHTHDPLGTIDLIKANACNVFNVKTLSSSLMLTDNYKSAICMLQTPSLCGPTTSSSPNDVSLGRDYLFCLNNGDKDSLSVIPFGAANGA